MTAAIQQQQLPPLNSNTLNELLKLCPIKQQRKTASGFEPKVTSISAEATSISAKATSKFQLSHDEALSLLRHPLPGGPNRVILLLLRGFSKGVLLSLWPLIQGMTAMLQTRCWRKEQEVVVAAGWGGGGELERTAEVYRVALPGPGATFIPLSLVGGASCRLTSLLLRVTRLTSSTGLDISSASRASPPVLITYIHICIYTHTYTVHT